MSVCGEELVVVTRAVVVARMADKGLTQPGVCNCCVGCFTRISVIMGPQVS